MISVAVLRRNWREVLLGTAIALPWLSLLVLGCVWLWQAGHVLPWAGGVALVALLAWPLQRAVARRSQAEARRLRAAREQPSLGWNAEEQAAWDKVQAFAAATAPFSFTERAPIEAAVRDTVLLVAGHFHPDTDDPFAHVTLPELLLLTERLSRDLRRLSLQYLPGIRSIRLGHLLTARRWHDQHGDTARSAWRYADVLWRGLRLPVNPISALAQEVGRFVFDNALSALSDRVRTHFTTLLVSEVGRAAIDLYSGRLALSEVEEAAARTADLGTVKADAASPVRVLLAGQVSAGKSSLLNAMAQEVRGAVGPQPTTAAATEHAIEVEGRPALVLVDTIGLTSGSEADEAFAEQLPRADLVLWVAAATQPGRAPDRRALDHLRGWAAARSDRRPPPILLALTKVDQLRPAGEWQPPYDIAAADRPKARSIRDAVEAVAGTLDLPSDAIVPVALPAGGEPYNIDALWARIGRELGEARLAQLDRLRLARSGLNLREMMGQLTQAGRMLVRAGLRG